MQLLLKNRTLLFAQGIRDCKGPTKTGSLSSRDTFSHSYFQDQEETVQTQLFISKSCCWSVDTVVLSIPITPFQIVQSLSCSTSLPGLRTLLPVPFWYHL